jgi:hypothetical protein
MVGMRVWQPSGHEGARLDPGNRRLNKASTHNPEKRALLACEDRWTRHATVILDPPSNEPVDTTPLFSPPTTCHGGTGDRAVQAH